MPVPTFKTLLPRLVATYEAGRLVPFIGSGMSRPAVTDWATFVQKLETEARRTKASPISYPLFSGPCKLRRRPAETIGRAN